MSLEAKLLVNVPFPGRRTILLGAFATSLVSLASVAGCGGSDDGDSSVVAPPADPPRLPATFSAVLTSAPTAPFSVLSVSIPDAEPQDEYSYKFMFDGVASEALRAARPANGNVVLVCLPPGKLTATGYIPSKVVISLVRTRAGAIATADLTHNIDALRPVPAQLQPAGLLLDLLAAVQTRVVQHGTSTAWRAAMMSLGEADTYEAKTYSDYVGAKQELPASELAYADLIAYNFLLSCGIDPLSFLKAGVVLAARELPQVRTSALTVSADFDIDAISSAMGSASREFSQRLMMAGAIAAGVGILGGISVIAGAGAIAFMVGLGTGLANGLIFDNLPFVADQGDPDLLPTVKFFAKNVLSQIVSVLSPLGIYAQPGNNRIGSFIYDQVNSFGSDKLADAAVGSAANAYSAVSTWVAGYIPASPSHGAPPVNSERPPGSRPCFGAWFRSGGTWVCVNV